jgi:O-antigen ligase
MLFIFLGMGPLFLVTLRFWSGAILILGSFFCLVSLVFAESKPTPPAPRFRQAIVLTLVAPLLLSGLSSMARGRYILAEYDSASRFVLAVAVFLWLSREQLNIARVLELTIPLGLFLTLFHQLFVPQPQLWGVDRMSTYFSDPLVFGYTALALGLMSLVSINFLGKDPGFLLAFKLLAGLAGFYLSIKSGSRTGWLSVPLVMVIWLRQNAKPQGAGKRWSSWIFGACVAVVLLAFFSSDTVSQRVALAFKEVSDYAWTGIAPETSVGFRITFLRIAADMFMSSPLVGFGDTRYESIAMPSQVYLYASPESIRVALTAGFHNEIVTSAIHFGMGGLVATCMLFFVPTFVFARGLRSANANQRANALLGTVLTTVFFVSSWSTEVFDLKYTASFYALMVAALAASSLSAKAGSGATSVGTRIATGAI